MKSLRIGIACYPTFGGSGVMATELGLALADRGHTVHLFSYARPTRLAHYHTGIEFHGVTVSSYPLFQYPPYDLALASTMREVMAERGLDILHVHYAVPHALSAHLACEMLSGCKARIVTTLHGTDITILGRDPSYRDVIKFGLEKSDAVVSVSEWLEQQTREAFGFEGPIHVLSNFVDQTRFKPRTDDALRRELGGEDHPLIAHTSNFRPLKRAVDTVEVLRRLGPDSKAVLLLVGDGPDLQLVRDTAHRAGLMDRVRFLGEVSDAETITAAADVALFPSESESFGLAALEAMACAVPVVSARVGGVPEVIEHGVSGFLREVGDCDGMARDVGRLLDDDALRRTMGQAGLRRTTEAFSLGAAVQRHEELYLSLLDESS
ncbi:MAG: N-acetyl-alpha-D-glucosaminyl L-malate synthase BshA [Planctomycetota bacterium]|jgi:N-acetyl-alpha-D-glucosaminyl L-malate synthase BshA